VNDPHEKMELLEQMDATNASAIERYVEAGKESVFAGSYLAPEAGLTYAGFTGDVELHERKLKSLVPHPEILRVVTVRWALAELERTLEEILEDEHLCEELDWRGVRSMCPPIE